MSAFNYNSVYTHHYHHHHHQSNLIPSTYLAWHAVMHCKIRLGFPDLHCHLEQPFFFFFFFSDGRFFKCLDITVLVEVVFKVPNII